MTHATRPVTRGRLVWRGFWFGVFIVAVLLHVVGGWVFSNKLNAAAFDVPASAEPGRDVEVVAIDDDTITLRSIDGQPDVARNRVMGFEVGGGYLQLGPVEDMQGPGAVTRSYQVLAGVAPSVSDRGHLQSYAYPADPAVAGLDVTTVTYSSPLGPMEAWVLDGSRSEWVIHVHGKGASPQEAIRLMRPLDDAGYHQMAIWYRNDPGQPADPSGMYQYGRTEWEDLAAAVEYAEQRGANDVFFVGYSTGGAIVLSYLYKNAGTVDGIVLDSPNVHMGRTVDFGAEKEELPFGLPVPSTVVGTAKFFTGLRRSVNWDAIDYLQRIGQLIEPTLLFHGSDDDSVPVDTSREMAERRPDFVTYVETPGAGHVESWNADPTSYEGLVLDFLADVSTG